MVRNIVGQVPIINDRVRVYRIRELFTKCVEGRGKSRYVTRERQARVVEPWCTSR